MVGVMSVISLLRLLIISSTQRLTIVQVSSAHLENEG